MARTRIDWNANALYKELEKKLADNAFAGAEQMADAMKAKAPVYNGPDRSSGRRPGTMRDGIKAKRLKKWSKVVIPHPAVFVEYGVDEDNRSPVPFISQGMEDVFKNFMAMHRDII